MALTKATYAMVDGAPVNVKDFGAVGDGTHDDTSAFQAAAATGQPIYMPYGEYVISSPVTFNGNLMGAGQDAGQTIIKLTGTGQLRPGDWYAEWRSFQVKSAVNNLTFIKNSGISYWALTDVLINKTGSATGQVGIEFDTSSASIYFNRVDNFSIRLDYPVKITGNSTQVFNANKIGMGVGGNKWFDFASAITVDAGVLATDANEFGGYFELGTNVITFNGVALRQNRFRLIVDAVTRIWNSSVAVSDMNLWEVLDGGFTYAGTQPQNQIFIGPPATNIRATNSVAQSIPNATATTLTYNVEQFDTLSEFAPGSGLFTPRYAGYYSVSAISTSESVAWDAGERWEIRIYKNGSQYASGDWNSADAAVSTQRSSSINTVVYMNGTTDTLDVRVIHNQGASVNTSASAVQNYVAISRA